MPNQHHRHPTHIHLSRPLDRGELEGLPALPLTVDEVEPTEDGPDEVSAARNLRRPRQPWPRYGRWLAEAGSLIALVGLLFTLVTHTMRVPGEATILCPAGTSEAVRLATVCRPAEPGDAQDEDE